MIADLDALAPPDFSDFSVGGYYAPAPGLPYLSSRGCPWRRCAFCTHRKTYLSYREETVERTVERLAGLRTKYGVSRFSFVDEMIHPRRFDALSRALIESGMEITYSAYAKPTDGFNRPLLERMHASGARVLMWGVESGNQRVLDAMKKGARVPVMERVLRDAHDAGIWNLVFLLFGFPSETGEEFEETVRFAERNRDSIDAISKSLFLLMPGSEVFRFPEKFHLARIIPRAGRDPISVAFDYEVERGLTPGDAAQLYRRHLPALGRGGRSPHFGVFRDHMLIAASAGRTLERPAQ
jgi:radical SAM superfamily enzyme YgiQ (UPF0313 family)